MKKNLVIVESGAKAKTITKYLNTPELNKKFGKFDVVASNGHIRDLIKKNMGFDERTFEATYEPIDSKMKTIKNLKENIKNHDCIWLAADQDREGEAIAWHIKEHFRLKKYKRITFNEITPNALNSAIHNSRDINYNLVDAQQCRRILDRLVGFKLTNVLWKTIDANTMLTAGRVQSVVLKIIVEKEQSIVDFISEPYWRIDTMFKLDKNEVDTTLYHNDVVCKFNSEHSVEKFFKSLTSKFTISEKNTKMNIIRSKPDVPFITSSLQQSAHNIGFSLAKTMKIAQELYEAGHITYMRTDCTSLSNDAMGKIKDYISDTYGSEYFSDNNSNVKSKSKNAQEAHEAIRPTSFGKKDLKLSLDQKKLYEMIFKRTIASQMKPAIYEELVISIKNTGIDQSFAFIGKMKNLIEVGYLIVYGEKASKSINDMKETLLNSKNIALKDITAKNVHTLPPQRFNESTIIKTLEKIGIGRPSTYATILNKLFERQYVVKKDVHGNKKEYIHFSYKKGSIIKQKETKEHYIEKSKIVPTETGFTSKTLLEKYFPNIIDVNFTNVMEDDLDEIALSHKKMKTVLKAFYGPFIQKYDEIASSIKNKNKIAVDKHNKTIKLGNTEYIIRNARYGPVIQENKTFIDLKAYLNDTNKSIDDIGLKDVKLLTSLPRKINNNLQLLYGRYGFYVKHLESSKTLRIYKQYIENVYNNDFDFIITKF